MTNLKPNILATFDRDLKEAEELIHIQIDLKAIEIQKRIEKSLSNYLRSFWIVDGFSFGIYF
jgi:hypothetical protein